MNRIKVGFIVPLLILLKSLHPMNAFGGDGSDTGTLRHISREVQKAMQKGDIPGLSIVIIQGNRQLIRSYGFADVESRNPVTSQTLFQLGSCSKAFTALAVQWAVKEGLVKIDDPVTGYIPWFEPRYKDSVVKITVRQLLHHTSGIPWHSISTIPKTSDSNALEQTIRNIAGIKLKYLPGKQYEYATVNYDILALIVEKVTGNSFEQYVQQAVFDRLQLSNTSMGSPKAPALMSAGYKIGFFKPRLYQAPAYKGNNAAGYVISNTTDIAKWLRFQMGLAPSELSEAAAVTHLRDETVPLHGMHAYGMGWQISLSGNNQVEHDGVNPNYTAYIAFKKKDSTGVAILANSNSAYTAFLGNRIMKMMAGEDIAKDFEPSDELDRAFSVISFILGAYSLIVLAFIMYILTGKVLGKRTLAPVSAKKMVKFLLALTAVIPVLYGLYLFPEAYAGFSWSSIVVWAPGSFTMMVKLMLFAFTITYLAWLLGMFYPEKNKFRKIIPSLLLMSTLSGLSNMVIIILVTSAVDSTVELKYLVFYYALAIMTYLAVTWFIHTNLTRFSRELTYDMRVRMLDKIFSTSYQRFEKIDRGRVYTSLNDDVGTIGGSIDHFVMVATNIFVVAGAFLYLASIAFWATLLTVLLLVALSSIYYFAGKRTHRFFEQSRDARNTFMRLINGMIDGFKEINLQWRKKTEYKKEMLDCAYEYKNKITSANTRFVNAYLVGESFLIVLLGLVTLGMPHFFPGIERYAILGFVVVLLYLIGPIKTILVSIPRFMELKIAWNRTRQFMDELPSGQGPEKSHEPVPATIDSFTVKDIGFRYKNRDAYQFEIGPIDLELVRGEILFIIGGNGSGKTTLAKLLTGLYQPDQGKIYIDGKPVESALLGEYFSAVFSPAHLFEKLYNVNTNVLAAKCDRYLQMLNLEDKVKITNSRYNTINLSGGQRKRLALLQCYLEDAPIYLFDEWAADQDPGYRQFFYSTILPEMKKMGKIVIAITHDEHYFSVADKVLKMEHGKLEHYEKDSAVTAGHTVTL